MYFDESSVLVTQDGKQNDDVEDVNEDHLEIPAQLSNVPNEEVKDAGDVQDGDDEVEKGLEDVDEIFGQGREPEFDENPQTNHERPSR